MIPTRKVEQAISLLFSVPAIFSEHLIKWEDELLRDSYDHNAFKYSDQPSVEEFRKAVAYQKARGDYFIKLEGSAPLKNSFGMEEEITLTMLLRDDAESVSWKINPHVKLMEPETEQLEQHEIKCFGPLYGESFAARNFRRRHEKMTYHGAYLENALVGACYTYSKDGYTCLDGLVVDRDYRHQYIATTLIKRIVETARKNSERVFLHADIDDTPKEMYIKLGFEEVDRIYEYVCTDFNLLKVN